MLSILWALSTVILLAINGILIGVEMLIPSIAARITVLKTPLNAAEIHLIAIKHTN